MTDNYLRARGSVVPTNYFDPWAWRSDMDAPRIEGALRPGPAPTGHDRVFDAAYNWLGGQPENRATASALTNVFDVGTLGMATGAYDGAAHLARTGEITPLALALMPGARVAHPIENAVKSVGQRVGNAFGSRLDDAIMAKTEAGYFPPTKRQRPFEADYARRTPQGDPGSPLERDIDGRPLTARLVAGRRTVGGPDVPLSIPEIGDVAEYAASRVEMVPRSNLPGRAVGTYDPRTSRIAVADDLSDTDTVVALAHETGHALDYWPHKANIAPHERGAREIFNDLATGQPRVNPREWVGPERFGYSAQNVPRELMAEAIRAYMQDPNYIKSVAPNLAKEIRKLNDVKGLNKIIQFNTPLAGLALGAASLWENGSGEQ